jgi:hypothetical protein
MYTTCPAVPEYQEAMLAWVRKIMELGADGLFVDNLGTRVPCFGSSASTGTWTTINHAFLLLKPRGTDHSTPTGRSWSNSPAPLSIPECWSTWMPRCWNRTSAPGCPR